MTTSNPRRPGRFIAWAAARRISLLLGTSAITALATVPTVAQNAPATQEAQATRDFAIAPQPLAAALRQFSEQSGMQLAYRTEELQGLSSPGVQGRHAPEAALRLLLANSSVTYSFTGTNTVTLARANSSGPALLPPVTAETARETLDPGRTEGTRSYAGSMATVGSKTAETIREIPQSVSVVTRQRIEDRNFTTYDQAMKETTGMVTTPTGHDAAQIKSRGYETQTQLDGLATEYSYVHGNGFDLAIYDRLEVLRGPSGLFMGGSSYPSGVVNFVHKRPTPEFSYGGAATTGAWNYYRGEADVSGPLFESERVRGRFVVAGQDNDTFVDVTHTRRGVGYGAVDIDLSEATTLRLGTAYQDQDGVAHYGLPAYASGRLLDVDRSTFIGADWNRKDNDSLASIADLEHRFDGGALMRVAARYVDRSSFIKSAFSSAAVDPVTNNVALNAFTQYDEMEEASLDAYVTTPFRILGQEHKLVLGGDYRTYDRRIAFGSIANYTTLNVYQPNHHFAEPNIPITFDAQVRTEQYGTYGQARIKPVDRLTLIGGLRASWFDFKSSNNFTGATLANYSIENEITPYYGAIFDVTENVSVYGAYSDIFVPQQAFAVGGKLLSPRIGSQYEAGVKIEMFDKSLIGHVAAFRIQDENRAMNDPSNPGFSIAAGEVRSQGFEAEISGKLTPQWDIFAGYAYTDTTFVKDATQTGNVFDPNVPKHLFNLWTKYSFEGGMLDRFSLGGGLKFASSTFLGTAPRITEDSYIVASAQIGYALTDDISATLTVNNLFDEVYYERVARAADSNYYGEPRSVWLTVRKSF